ncbi:MAG: hypothetical protein HN738_04230 [Gammaproteobacteria bacterium]|jgi:ectoine hydroxylase-related dioxygenase (phytanoyl-CoA dioxygenase family)|nr:hypothetical protein [Gammaproteobacteria bacterium]
MTNGDLPKPTSNLEEGRSNLDRFGYTIHKDFFTADQTRRMRARLEEQASMELEVGHGSYGMSGYQDVAIGASWSPSMGLPRYQQVSFLPNKGSNFVETVGHPTAMAYVNHVLPLMPSRISTVSGLVVRPGAAEMITHIDQASIPFGTPCAVGLNFMFALTDFVEELGATRIVPGSHLQESPDMTLPIEDIAAGKESVPAICDAGSAIIFESRTWHCQGKSSIEAEGIRYSFVTNYQYCFLLPQENYPASLHDDVYETLTEDQKRLLGFETVNGMGRIAPRFPGDRSNCNETFPFTGEMTALDDSE